MMMACRNELPVAQSAILVTPPIPQSGDVDRMEREPCAMHVDYVRHYFEIFDRMLLR